MVGWEEHMTIPRVLFYEFWHNPNQFTKISWPKSLLFYYGCCCIFI